MSFYDLHRPIDGFRLNSATRWIIFITGILLVVQLLTHNWMSPYLGLVPGYVTHRYWLWQTATYMFLHSGVFHWLFNMLIFWMFGSELERRWGTREFLKYFFITGIGSALCVIALTPNGMVPTIGASGAVFGLITAFAMLFPDAVMYLYFLIPMKVWHAALLFAFIELVAGLEGGGSGIARFAHLGGMVTGFLYLRYWNSLRINSKGWFSSWRRHRRPVELHEVTDELVTKVDRILDKVLREGVESLTPEEKKIMDRYARTKH